jgi:hypothetical protein
MFKSFAAYDTASIETGGGGDVQRCTGDLREVDDKTIPNNRSPNSLFPMAMMIADDNK